LHEGVHGTPPAICVALQPVPVLALAGHAEATELSHTLACAVHTPAFLVHGPIIDAEPAPLPLAQTDDATIGVVATYPDLHTGVHAFAPVTVIAEHVPTAIFAAANPAVQSHRPLLSVQVPVPTAQIPRVAALGGLTAAVQVDATIGTVAV
jgi:hypothetical protein